MLSPQSSSICGILPSLGTDTVVYISVGDPYKTTELRHVLAFAASLGAGAPILFPCGDDVSLPGGLPVIWRLLCAAALTTLDGEFCGQFRLVDPADTLVRGTGDWVDDDGDFGAFGELEVSDDGVIGAEVSIPLLAPKDAQRVHAIRAVAVFEEQLVAATSDWDFDGFRQKERFENNRLGAAIAAAVALWREAGGPSAAERTALVERLTALFVLDDEGEQALEATLKLLLGKKSIDPSAEEWLDDDADFAAAVAGVLEQVARADGELTAREQKFLAAFAEEFGLPSRTPPPPEPERDPGPEAEPERPRVSSLTAHYEALDLKEGVTLAEVKAAYRRLAAEYHPDRTALMGTRFQDFATREMQRLNAAWAALSAALKS